MKCTILYNCRLTAALCGLLLALAFVPMCSAQAQTTSVGQTTQTTSSAAVLSQLQQLQDEVKALQGEIAVLKQKQSEAPLMKPAVFVQPVTSVPASVSDAGAPAPATTAAETSTMQAQAPAPKVTLASLLGPTTLSGLVDGYYGYDFNHPASMQTGLEFFAANENQFALSLVELSASKTPDASSGVAGRTGYTVSLGFGQTINAVNGSDGLASGAQYIKEAYFSYLAPVGTGLKIDVGKFVTTAGEEVIESNANWNYSRSILFYYAIPFYHYGVRATYAPNSKVSLQASITNGWNNIVATPTTVDLGEGNYSIKQNTGKTYGGSISITPNAKWGITETYYAGPIQGLGDWRQLSDTIVSYTPNAKWAFAVNGDYGHYHEPMDAGVAKWWGPAGYVKYSLGANDNLAIRYEYYGDPQGFTLFGGIGGHAQEVTTTYTHVVANALMTRFEYRYDFASSPIFERGLTGAVKTQNSLLLGLVYSFSSQNAK